VEILALAEAAQLDVETVAGPDQGFIHNGKWPLLFLLFGLIVSFVFVRINTRLIRKQVSWWPGNIESGDVHVHHVVIGFILMTIVGILEFALQPDGWTQRILALLFGMGLGVSLDEFALIFHLEDVYWKDQGRKSIDAVVVVMAFILMLLVGLVPLGISEEFNETPWWALVGTIVAHSIFVLITLLKGKIWWGLLGIFIPVLAWIAAFRLARPGSPWAHWFYKKRPKKLARAKRRAERYDRTLGRLQDRIWDLIGGKPGRPQPKARGLTLEEVVPDDDRSRQDALPLELGHEAGAEQGSGASD
jgi:lysyl-tRNA synthetase class 2